MNRFKRELRRRGEKLENDYDCLPCDGIEAIRVNAEKAMMSIYHVSAGWMHVRYTRRMEVSI